MTRDEKKKLLTLEYRLDHDDFYIKEDDWGDKIILRRTGIDKIEAQIGMNFTVENMQVVPYGDKVSVTILGRGQADGVVSRTVAMTNPDNCAYPNYAEVCEKRCRHRILLKLARLYEHHIFSEIESEKFTETRNQFIGAVDETVKMLNSNSRFAKKNKEESSASPEGTGIRKKTISIKKAKV